MDDGNRVAIGLTTVDSAVAAESLARRLVEERLAACVNILPGLRSVYRWQGEMQDGAEWQLVIKTSAARLQALHERLLALHPYDTPEWLVLDVASASQAYRSWVLAETDATIAP